jgi:uncharacterized Fe-S cluster-containing radical SAM superfamily protein
MKLETIERGLRNLSDADMAVLGQQFAAAFAKAQRPAIRKLELFVTEDCNLRCDYCWVPKHPRVMSFDRAKRAIDFLLEDSAQWDTVNVTLFGGEPLLEWELVRRIMTWSQDRAAAVGKRIEWALTTNGTLLTQEIVQFGRAHRVNYLLSIDGAETAHDAHRRFADGRPSFAEVAERLPLLKRFQGWGRDAHDGHSNNHAHARGKRSMPRRTRRKPVPNRRRHPGSLDKRLHPGPPGPVGRSRRVLRAPAPCGASDPHDRVREIREG